MKKALYFIACIFFLTSTNAQTPDWQWAKNSISQIYTVNEGTEISVDANGNSYVAGHFSGDTITFGNTILTNSGGRDIFITKYSPSGNVVWAKSMVGSSDDDVNAIVNDADGNLYMIGTFKSTSLILGNITLINSSNSVSYTDVFVTKLDPLGNILWAKRFGNTFDDNGADIQLDAMGNLWIIGHFENSTLNFDTIAVYNNNSNQSNSNFDIFVVKLDALGNAIIAKSFGASGLSNTMAKGIAIDPFDNIYITGTFGLNIIFDSLILTNPYYGDINLFTAKITNQGNAVWAKQGAGHSEDNSSAICTDVSGNVYITGHFQSHFITFDNDTLYNLNQWFYNNDVFTVKYDSLGSVVWVKQFGVSDEDFAFDICVNIDGTVFVTGENYPVGNSIRFYIVAYDASGNQLWVQQNSGNRGAGNSITVDVNNNLFVTGYMQSPTFSFGNIVLTQTNTNSVIVAKGVSPYEVWPGDTNHDLIVNNNDFLSIGLYYGQNGIARDSVSNLWQANSSADWGTSQFGGLDVKHVDCNGDSIINSDDTLAINLNYSLSHMVAPPVVDELNYNRQLAPLSIITNGAYNAGDWVNAEIWVGDSTSPVNNLYGIAFDVKYDASLIEPGTETIVYPIDSWLGSLNTDVIKISKMDIINSVAYSAITRIDHVNRSGYGKIADFKFQIKTTLTQPATMQLSIVNYSANDSSGYPQLFYLETASILINYPDVSVNESQTNLGVKIYPNPFTNHTTINYNINKKSNLIIELYATTGQKLTTLVNTVQEEGDYTYTFSAKEKGFCSGIYFVKITVNGNSTLKKIVEME